ncbi:MAG: hypothetical protein ACNS60_18295 [Candidatus Cyclobacteriaceae bacterium M2_1C_046]
MIKNLKVYFIAFVFMFFLAACEGNVQDTEVIAACENQTGVDCSDCCKNNGYDSGSYSSTDNECKCITLN